MPQALLSIGSNLGDRRQHLESALDQLRRTPQLSLISHSKWHETDPIGGPANQGVFLNGAVWVETTLEPEALLNRLQEIEQRLGRIRTQRWDARPLDLDLLLYDQLVWTTNHLTLPHPRLSFRRFVLEPAEICPDMLHPVIGWTLAELLAHLNQARPYIALAGVDSPLIQQLADTLVAQQIGPLVSYPHRSLTVRSLSEWLNLAQAYGRLLDPKKWIEPQPTLSNFWFDQLRLEAQLMLCNADFLEFCQTWSALRQHIVQPKLTILICPSLPDSSPTQRRQLQANLVAYASTPNLGPVLTLATDNPDLLLSDTSAALKAFQ